ncbi:hypothetical protein [Fimbriiglobus ruber]|uniref:hypothetical protein n=1 Tax=Fimbriiglobus ruber TaxID=1908690 RepID=UPI000B4BD38B|nr:hypothetical protein [Fimbriiglobus ruber]
MTFGELNHLPICPIDPERYDRLYAFNHDRDDRLPAFTEWNQIRIQEGFSEERIYRLLPSAVEFEYSGCLTKSRIRYVKADSSSAGMLMAKPCTFHSHPTKNRYLADIPSLQDIHSFLFYRQLRSITVGGTKIWVWDKTKAALRTVRKLATWMEANHFRVVTHWMKEDADNWQVMYVQTVMKHLGWVWPDTIDEMDVQWPQMLRDILKIQVRVLPREPRVKSR